MPTVLKGVECEKRGFTKFLLSRLRSSFSTFLGLPLPPINQYTGVRILGDANTTANMDE
jgi:hypothetical protein